MIKVKQSGKVVVVMRLVLQPVQLYNERGVVRRVCGAGQRGVLAHNGLNEEAKISSKAAGFKKMRCQICINNIFVTIKGCYFVVDGVHGYTGNGL